MKKWRRKSVSKVQPREEDGPLANLTALLEVQTRTLGADHRETLYTRCSLLILLGQIDDLDSATTGLATLGEAQALILGPDHPDTLRTHAALASFLDAPPAADQDEPSGADYFLDQFRDLLEKQALAMGPDHPDTLKARDRYEEWKKLMATRRG